MTRQRTWSAAGLGLAFLGALTAVAVLEHRGDPAVNVAFVLVSAVAGAAFGGTGALLTGVRPGNAVGPLLLLAGGGLTVEFALREYAFRGLPFAGTAAWAGLALDPLFFPTTLALVLFCFPDGRVNRRLLAAGLAVPGAMVLLLALRSGPLPDESYGYEVPWSGPLPGRTVAPVVELLTRLGMVLLVIAVGALAVRFVRADPDGRQRLKPLALAAPVAVAFLLLNLAPALRPVATPGLVVAVALGFPAALAVGALRYRVWDLDPILTASLTYGALTVLITGLYVGTAVGLAAVLPSSVLPSIAGAAVVAVAFAPAKDRLNRAARRLVYGVRASPYEALATLPHRLAEVPAADEVLPHTAEALTQGLGVAAARVRARLDGGYREAWSPAPPAGDGAGLVVVEVRHLGEVVGDVAVQPWADRPLGAPDRRLLADLAAQAGPALRGVALTAELRARLDELHASRQRIGAAQARERRRLERDIHDGAQQRLVALAVGLRAAERSPSPEAFRQCQEQVQACIDELRELARGVYPPVLAARGLPAALRAHARSVAADVTVSARDDVRLDPDREVAVYFAGLEALQNAAKHAPGARVAVALGRDGDGFVVTVTDDGPGFDPAGAAARGTGLVGMADRIATAGGTFSVDSTPGHGTTIRMRMPPEVVLAPPRES